MKKRILLIDDEKTFTRLVKNNLEATGRYEVHAENDGKRALATALEFKPDLIFLDIVMPEIDGTEVAAQLIGNNAFNDVPIIFLTALFFPEETEKITGIFMGNSFLRKPVTAEKLIETIEEYIGH